MLKIEGLKYSYGPVEALHGIDLEVRQGEVVAVIGPNGAGKTTLLRAISGLARPSGGKVEFRGKDITGLKPHHIVRQGLVHVPQGRGIFGDQTVEANLRLGAYAAGKAGNESDLLEREYNRFPILGQRRKQLSGYMSGGEAQMLAISRALMSDPPFIALDEPSLGLAPLVVRDVIRTVEALNKSGITVLIVEQMANLVLSIASRGYVLQRGKVVATGTGRDLLKDPALIASYMG